LDDPPAFGTPAPAFESQRPHFLMLAAIVITLVNFIVVVIILYDYQVLSIVNEKISTYVRSIWTRFKLFRVLLVKRL